MSYAFATFALLVIFAVGMSVLDNYEKLSYVEKKVESLTSQVSAISETSVNTQNSTSPSDSAMATNMGDSNRIEKEDENNIGIETDVIGNDSQSELTAEQESDTKTLLENLATTDENQAQEETTEDVLEKTATPTISTEGKQSYIVEQGDTLQIISMKIYQTTDKVDEIMELNQIENADKILVGEKIWLP